MLSLRCGLPSGQLRVPVSRQRRVPQVVVLQAGDDEGGGGGAPREGLGRLEQHLELREAGGE